MVSHAHGQGYADLHFVIPETLETIDVYKGPYFAEFGNLAPAGVLQLRLRESFDENFIRFQGGSFGARRVVVGFSPQLERGRGLIALEGLATDGPFLSPQKLHRANLITRWTVPLGRNRPGVDEKLHLLATAYDGRWNASGQIPHREVEAGRLDRFGSLDPSEGGDTRRLNFALAHQRLWSNHILKSQLYAVRYDLDLYSNFTFFERDPENGDGILQRDRRWMRGGRTQYSYLHRLGGRSAMATAGMDWRQDHIRNGLFYQAQREVFGTALDSRVLERNTGFYWQEEVVVTSWLKAIVGVRHDRFRFEAGGLGGQSRSFTGPKASLILSPSKDRSLDLFFNYGRGFHSNDARAVVQEPGGVALAAANGYEIGLRRKLVERLEISAAYWMLDLAGELVWVGDEGATELRGSTRRHGPEVEIKWRISRNLYWDANMSRNAAFFRAGGGRVPRAPNLLAGSGLSLQGLAESRREPPVAPHWRSRPHRGQLRPRPGPHGHRRRPPETAARRLVGGRLHRKPLQLEVQRSPGVLPFPPPSPTGRGVGQPLYAGQSRDLPLRRTVCARVRR